jgi:hypothetical protein
MLTSVAALKSNTTAPAITKINGKDAATFINELNLKFSILQQILQSQHNSNISRSASYQYDNRTS